jgi:hypothetical protein
MEQAKLLSITIVLTGLIWAGADSLVNERVTLNLPMEVAPAPGLADLIVDLNQPGELYEIVVSGPRKLVDDLGARIQRIRLRVPDRTPGKAVLNLDRATVKQALTVQWKEFRKLTVLSVQPSNLAINVDRWISRDIEIAIRRLSLAYEVEPQAEPSAATVRIRESVWTQLTAGQDLQLDITDDVERLLKERPPGERVTVRVPLDARRFGSGAELNPAGVEVTAVVKARRKTAVIPTVPILVAVSFANLERPYQAVSRDGTPLTLVTQSVSVVGPIEDINRLERGATRIYGVIHLKQQDLEQVNVLRIMTPDYYLPPGVSIAEPTAPIEFKLVVTESKGDE